MLIKIKVKTKVREEKVEKLDDFNYSVWVKELPEKGKANKAILRLMASYFKISEQRIKIISGRKSKNKTIEII